MSITPYSETADYLTDTLGFGPYGDGFNLTSPGGFNVGFGECIWGFDAFPVVVAQLGIFLVDPGLQTLEQKAPAAFMDIEVVNNVDENPDYPVFVGCSGAGLTVKYIEECRESAPVLTLFAGEVSTVTQSWGALKSLY